MAQWEGGILKGNHDPTRLTCTKTTGDAINLVPERDFSTSGYQAICVVSAYVNNQTGLDQKLSLDQAERPESRMKCPTPGPEGK